MSADTEAEPRKEEEEEEKKEKKKKDNYFEKEYKRLRDKLEKMKQEIKKVKDERQETTFTPNIYNSLEPYSNTKTVETVMSAPTGNVREVPVSRATSIGICEPWESLRIDQTVLPKGETYVLSPPHDRSLDSKKGKKEGMSHYPKIRNVNIDVTKYVNKHLDFDDVPALRKDLRETYTAEASAKIEEDYNQTMEDYTRMELDVCLDELKPPNRDIVRDAMLAYLQNTPGSRKALFQCLRDADKKQKEKEEKEKEEKEKEEKEKKDEAKDEKKEEKGEAENGTTKEDTGEVAAEEAED